MFGTAAESDGAVIRHAVKRQNQFVGPAQAALNPLLPVGVYLVMGISPSCCPSCCILMYSCSEPECVT